MTVTIACPRTPHSALGRKAGVSPGEIAAAREGRSTDPRTAAALAFVLRVVEQRGDINSSEVDAVRAAGFDDAQIVELLAQVALNLFTNYVNIALAVPVDFPVVRAKAA